MTRTTVRETFNLRAFHEVEDGNFVGLKNLESDRALAVGVAKKTANRMLAEVKEAAELLRFLARCHPDLWEGIGTPIRTFQQTLCGSVAGINKDDKVN